MKEIHPSRSAEGRGHGSWDSAFCLCSGACVHLLTGKAFLHHHPEALWKAKCILFTQFLWSGLSLLCEWQHPWVLPERPTGPLKHQVRDS